MTRDELRDFLEAAHGSVGTADFYDRAASCGYTPRKGTLYPFTELVDVAVRDERLRAKLLLMFG